MQVSLKQDSNGFNIEREKIIRLLYLFDYTKGTCRSVSEELGWSKSKVQVIWNKCRKAGLTYLDALEMQEDEIARVLGMESQRQVAHEISDEYWEWVCRKLTHKSCTLQYIWTDFYSKDNPDGLGYSQFCKRYKEWLSVAKVEIILPQERVPGREIFVDWVGDTIQILDSGDASLRTAYFFVSTMGDSSYPYVEAFLSMQQKEWVQAHINMFEYYGGVSRLLIPDNTKTAITAARLYDPELNHAYRDMAVHYGIGIAPARVRKPKDKGSVEAGVKWVEHWLVTWLADNSTVYKDIAELNHDIRKRMAELVERKFKNRAGTRKSVFEAIDKPELRPLPKDKFLFFDTLTKKSLPANWHFDIKEKQDTFYYSFPYNYVKKEGYAHLYPDKVEIYVKGVGRVAVHVRRLTGKRYITDIAHAPKNQQERMQYNNRTGQYYRSKAYYIGPYTSKVVDAILKNGVVEEQGYKSCDGILRMAENYGDHVLEGACQKAWEAGRPNYTGVKLFIDKTKNSEDGDRISPWNRDHENLRHDVWE